ncbi:Sec-independent protein translocase subunit TatA [Intrasporangium calvum]|uniref:Sec-independent protein translocase protein TatA n=1 Tax=Intrasporangium calvum TaxID=53358 RepID=A0ABT5GID1_9MICO|nr:Sec-independent protein translocase subunit TatA [Intrasporangium calvum]MDC5697441.1 Sec-independent protein translocase subunit TatA [Intrasporangium calvum]
MPNLGAPELIVIAVIIIALFGWKRLPDMARSLGRSARVFKSEVDEMKKDGKTPSDAAQSTVKGDVVDDEAGRRVAEAEAEAKAAEARAREAEARAAQARADADRDRFRSDPSL